MMELWLFQGESMGDALRHIWNLWAGKHMESDQVRKIPVRSLTVEAETSNYAQVDGEPLEASINFKLKVRKRALKVLTPPQTPRSLFGAPDNERPPAPSHGDGPIQS
jgi:diacylglycerol kinase family enzyme